MKWIVEIDYCAATGIGYEMWTARSFKEAKMLADRISKRSETYLVSLYRFTESLITGINTKEPRAYIQRSNGKLHSANSDYYKTWETPANLTQDQLICMNPYRYIKEVLA